MKEPKLYVIEINGCEIIDLFYCSYDLEKELNDIEKDFVESKIKQMYFQSYGEELDLTYWKVKGVQ